MSGRDSEMWILPSNGRVFYGEVRGPGTDLVYGVGDELARVVHYGPGWPSMCLWILPAGTERDARAAGIEQ